ncbi:hypothetical protein K227x_11070 [Rubripirellula lacrimiformis]|uniref:Uncharacterized protein n=2 Tax=Rubripirellula lacrimiformis TaxID=1930273 RepID=A0A517N6G2_9BACT|nr:hypothetical protein K227x_11070 [Rubripirellula lacrimiformis]
MKRYHWVALTAANFAFLIWASLVWVGSATSQDFDTPQTRLRPIGAPSAVDQYIGQPADRYAGRADQQTPPSASFAIRPAVQYRETAYNASPGSYAASPIGTASYGSGGGYDSSVRQTAMQQMTLPSGATTGPGGPVAGTSPGFTSPPSTGFPVTPPPAMTASPGAPQFTPPTTSQLGAAPNNGAPMNGSQPRSLPSFPSQSVPLAQQSIGSSSDLTPIPQPQMSGGGFATIYNCPNVSAPSSYSAASGIGCGQVGYQAPTGYAPSTLVPMTNGTLPPGTIPPPGQVAAPIAVAPANSAPVGPLLNFGQSVNPVQVGPGLLGQPTAYVPGQYVRNWLRYLTP